MDHMSFFHSRLDLFLLAITLFALNNFYSFVNLLFPNYMWCGRNDMHTLINAYVTEHNVKITVKVKLNVKLTLEWATKARKESRCIALLFLQPRRQIGWVFNATPRPLNPQERPDTHCTGDWVGPMGGLDLCRKSRPNRDLIPGLFSP